MSKSIDVGDNHLLAMLAPDEKERIRESLELVEFSPGESLCEPHLDMKCVYFPIDSIVSLLCVTENGGSAEIAAVGSEGIVGVSSFMGGDTSHSRAVVRAGGYGYRMPSRLLQDEFYRGGPMQRLLLRYTQALLTQMAQLAVCNRHHSVYQQLCRLLLLSHDRLRSTELYMTQELIANTLGVRREGITEAAGKLQKAGLIEYYRGHITILDRAGLGARTCECYHVVKGEHERLLPQRTADHAGIALPLVGRGRSIPASAH